MTDKYVILYVM